MEVQQFARRVRDKKILKVMGHKTYGHMFGGGSVPAHIEDIIETLPVDHSHQKPLRDADGNRLYPAGYLPAGEGPAN